MDLIRKELVDLKDDGSLWLNMDYFPYCHGTVMTGGKFADLFGGPARRPEAPITQREMDLAASIQVVTEEAVLRAARHVHKQTGMKNLVLAGGVALNCVGNGRILREGPFENIWIQPAAGDAGGAWERRCLCGINCSTIRENRRAPISKRAPCWDQAGPTNKFNNFWTHPVPNTTASTAKNNCWIPWPT